MAATFIRLPDNLLKASFDDLSGIADTLLYILNESTGIVENETIDKAIDSYVNGEAGDMVIARCNATRCINKVVEDAVIVHLSINIVFCSKDGTTHLVIVNASQRHDSESKAFKNLCRILSNVSTIITSHTRDELCDPIISIS